MMDDQFESETLTLSDGRQLGYLQCGSKSRGCATVLFMHGHPGSRIEAVHFHDLGLKLGARIITLDRPGFGLSSPQPGRTLLDWPKDVQQLVDHLKLDSYGILGVSGGGPYALACAYSLPTSKLRCLSIVCGLGPSSEIGMKGAQWLHWITYPYGYRWVPKWFNRWFWPWLEPSARLDWTDEKRFEAHMKQFPQSMTRTTRGEKDYRVMTDEKNVRVFLRSARESFAHGFDHVLQDGQLLCYDFGFRIEDIPSDLPVQLWYGQLDVNVPPDHGITIARWLGDRAELFLKDETHASIFFNWREDVLAGLIKHW